MKNRLIPCYFFFKYGDAILLLFESNVQGFLALPKPSSGSSQCDDQNPAGEFKCRIPNLLFTSTYAIGIKDIVGIFPYLMLATVLQL